MVKDTIHQLPIYPSTQTRKSFSPTQLATLNQAISSSLLQITALPPSKRDSVSAFAFVTSYAKDRALQDLEGLIWKPTDLRKEERLIRKQALILTERIASTAPGFDINSLIDLSIVYAPTNISRVKLVFESALKSNPGLVQLVATELVPAFLQLLNPSQGLYAIRKASRCVTSFLYASPPEIVRCFAHNKSFILALATLYDQGLTSIAHSYGGLSVLRNQSSGTVDEWEPIWVQTKVDLIDSFHVIITTLLNDLSASSGESLAAESERAFEIIFALLEIPSVSPNTPSETSMPYLDRPLLTDYQESYSLSATLASALHHAAEKDARIDLLESSLQALESSSTQGSSSKSKDAGVLKILLRSSGFPPDINKHAGGVRDIPDKNKGKEKAPPPTSHVLDIEIKTTQVLDILPDHPPDYIRSLLEYYLYEGNPEKVIEALLEGTAPTAEELRPTQAQAPSEETDDVLEYVKERKNVFDDDAMDLSRVRIGKTKQDASALLKDRAFVEHMKADILRRAEEMDNDDEDEDEDGAELPQPYSSVSKDKGVILAFDDDDALVTPVKIEGDGEGSDEEDEEGEVGEQSKPQNPETILELAYLRDPKLFDRDAQTRRSKARGDLKAQTGWGDEQIEGWKIMLERNPRKDKILQKHEFAGNRNVLMGISSSSNNQAGSGGRNEGSGSGSDRGAARGRGGGGRGRGGEPNSAKERAWKDKNKASRGNHNRKRGHDKKLARAGAGPST